MIYVGTFPGCEEKMVKSLEAGQPIEVDCDAPEFLIEFLKSRDLHGVIKHPKKVKNRLHVFPADVNR